MSNSITHFIIFNQPTSNPNHCFLSLKVFHMSMEEINPDLMRSRSGYQKLAVVSSSSREISESKAEASEGKPVGLFRSKTTNDSIRAKAVAEAAKSHPLFNLGDARRRKKAMKNPDFLRYMQYVKEGGTWDANSNTPSIYFK